MIGWLSGTIVDKQQPGKIVLNVNGVGYDLETSLSTFFQIESHPGQISLHVHTVVREDALLLYGFAQQDERSLFRALIKVNGVGPKVAIAILSSISPDEFIQCILQQNTTMLTKLPGIGKKTAERLVVEMKDSVQQFSPVSSTKSSFSPSMSQQEEAISALETLGYKPQEAITLIRKIDDGQKSSEQLIRMALQHALTSKQGV
ncbi:MAG: Holliday junction branch migration protein RuvA [Legionellaceae bacterium]|nr:Holliday junction branch migration protein RuvA [Legionellaceae bacterium]MBP9775664.1 Holliday junction branch migration protein RuvA [Legionellaceae bacterium]